MRPEAIGLSRSTIALGKLSGKHAFEERARSMGYSLTEEELEVAFARFKVLADKKRSVEDEDVVALAEEATARIPATYALDLFQISSGNKSSSTATVSLVVRGGEAVTDAAVGTGSVDAAFNAVDRATGMSVELKEYSLRAVTGGKDAQGEVVVRVESGGRPYMGRGVSTDILEASVKAYLSAINRVIHEQGGQGAQGAEGAQGASPEGAEGGQGAQGAQGA
jgi:2-isopropylmalate synthase